MADRIKGITIEIGGDTTGLTTALKGVNSEIRNTQSQLKDVERLLKLDPSNTELLSQKQRLLTQAVNETKEKLETLKEANRQAAESASRYDEWKTKYDPIKTQIDETKKKLDELKAQSKNADEQLANGEISQEKYDALQEEIKQTSQDLETLKDEAKEVSDEFGNPISPEKYDALQREIIETEQNLRDLEEQADQSNVALQKIGVAGEKIKEFGGKVTDAGKALLPVTGAIAAAGGASAKMAMDFEDAMAKLDTIADTSQVPLAELEQAILDLSNQTGISSAEIAGNVYDAISAGQETGDAVNFVSNATKLAKAGFADAGSALDILTTIMNAYGLEASEVNEVSDILIQTQNLGKTTVGELSTAMGKVIPTAKANGVALDQVAAGYAIMTSNGVATAETTTYMNSMLNELGKSGTKVSDVIKKKTGKSFKELMDGGASLADVLDIVSDSADEQGLAFGDLWSSAEAGKAALILLGDGADGFNGTLKEMQNSTGATETAFGKLDTKSYELQKTVNQLKNDAIVMGKSILDTLAPILERLSRKIQELHEWFSNLDEGQRETIVVIGLLVAALGPLLIVIGQITTGVGGLMTMVSTIGPAIGALGAAGGPILLTVAAFGLLAGAVYDAQSRTSEYYAEAVKLTDQEQLNKQSVDELYSSYELMNQQRADAAAAANAEALKEQALFDELQGIADENGNVKAGYEERARYILGELSTALGQEYTLTGNQIQNYKDMCGSIDALIVKKQANALLNANEAAYAEAITNQTEAFMTYNDAQKNVEETKKALGEAQRQEARYQMELNALWAKSAETGVDVTYAASEVVDKMIAASEASKGYAEKLSGLNQTLASAELAYIDYNTTIANYEGLSSAIISGDQQKMAEAVLATSNNFQTAEIATRESLERQVQTLTEKYQAMKEAVNAGAPGITQEQVNQMKELVNRSKAELDRLPEVVGSAADSSIQSLVGKSGESKAAGQQVGSDYSAGNAQGILEGLEAVETAATGVANAGVAAARAALDSHSPSRVTYNIGLDYDAGFAGGIAEGTEGVCAAVNSVAQGAIKALQTALEGSSTAVNQYQSTIASNWRVWATGLETTLTASLTNIYNASSTKLASLKSLIESQTMLTSADWKRKWTEMQVTHQTVLTDIQKTNENLLESIKEKFKSIITEIQKTHKTTLESIQMLSSEKTKRIKDNAIEAFEGMSRGIKGELDKLEPAVRAGFDPAVLYITGLNDKSYGWGVDMMQGYIRGVRSKIGELAKACEEAADTVSDYMHFTRPEKGPLRYYEEWMPHMMEGLAKGIRDNRSLLTDQVKTLAADMSLSMPDMGTSARQPVNLKNYIAVTLDGKLITNSVNERLGILL